MKKRFLLVLAACLLGALAMTVGCGSAPDSADTQATEPQVLRVGMDASYPPFGSQNQETKDYEGFDVDIIRAIAAEEGFDIEISNRSFDGLIPALQAREIDVAINDITITDDRRQSVDFSQPYYIAGLGVVVRADNDTIRTAEDLQGKTLGVWFGGNEYPFLNWMNKLGYKPDTDIKVLKQGFNVDPLLQNQAACISTMIYNEYWQIVDAGVKETDLTTFFYEEQGVASLEDGLYVLDSNLKDKAFVAKMAKFLKASFKGWNDAVKKAFGAAL